MIPRAVSWCKPLRNPLPNSMGRSKAQLATVAPHKSIKREHQSHHDRTLCHFLLTEQAPAGRKYHPGSVVLSSYRLLEHEVGQAVAAEPYRSSPAQLFFSCVKHWIYFQCVVYIVVCRSSASAFCAHSA